MIRQAPSPPTGLLKRVLPSEDLSDHPPGNLTRLLALLLPLPCLVWILCAFHRVIYATVMANAC